ncbi:ABC transporter substrate-binding protein [Candidatus Poriferisocius sp.]|uniref:ABC transporter substrate-binding protein n=1 Tax=Candidatus Poriferisocius sp. TaxID=3101276 RepID=UPI003B023449
MKIKSKLLVLVAVLFTMALVAGACGNDDDDSSPADTPAPATQAPEEPMGGDEPDAEPSGEDEPDDEPEPDDGMSLAGTVVTILGPETGTEAEGFLAGFDPLTERTGITVNYSGNRDATTELSLALEAGNPPDIVIIPQPGRIIEFGEDGEAVALPQSLLDNISGAYDPFWFDLATTTGGQVYGVPNKGDVKSLVWYSPSLFDERGYEIPTSWDELEALTEKIKADGLVPWCIGIGSGDATGWVFTDWMEDMMLRIHGPDVYDQWVSHEIPFNDPRVVEVAEFVGDIWFGEGNVLGGRDLIASTGFQEAALPIIDGDCVLHRQANFAGAFFTAAEASLGPNGDVNVFYLPTISDEFGTVVLGAGTHAVAFTDKPETLAVMEYIGTAEYANARIMADKGGFLSPNREHDTSLYSSDFDRGLADILVSADPFRFDASDLMPPEVGAGEFWRSGTDYVSGSKSAQEFADDTEDAWPSS